jgi:hypothetical protein
MIVVRLLRDGLVIRESVFARAPITIGRSPESDFVVVDATVSKVHARLEEDPAGTLVLRDLGSRNGIHVGPSRTPACPVAGMLHCHVGLAEIEILVVGEADTQEVALGELRRFDKRRGLVDHGRLSLVGVAGWLAFVMMAPSFWSPWREDKAVTLLWSGLGALVGLPSLAFGLMVGLRAVGRRVRVGDTLQALSRLVWLWPTVLLVSYASYYMLPSPAHGLVKPALVGVAVVATVLHLVALRRRGPSARFRLVWLAVVAGICAGLFVTAEKARRETGEPDTDDHVQVPVGGMVGPSAPLDVYLARLREVAEAASREAREVEARQGER